MIIPSSPSTLPLPGGELLLKHQTSSSSATTAMLAVPIRRNDTWLVSGHLDGTVLVHQLGEWGGMSMRLLVPLGGPSGDGLEGALSEVRGVGVIRRESRDSESPPPPSSRMGTQTPSVLCHPLGGDPPPPPSPTSSCTGQDRFATFWSQTQPPGYSYSEATGPSTGPPPPPTAPWCSCAPPPPSASSSSPEQEQPPSTSRPWRCTAARAGAWRPCPPWWRTRWTGAGGPKHSGPRRGGRSSTWRSQGTPTASSAT